MTATERAKRSDALYYETVSVNRRVLCDMAANREADLEDARADNAKLRDGANAMRQLYEDELKHALADNAKLRELAVGMYGMLEMVDKMLGNHDACETPRPLIFGEDKSFKDVMREMGVVK